jgi:antitoxin HicB
LPNKECLERAKNAREIVAEQLAEAMKAQGITKSVMAERIKTSRRQLDRLLDLATPSVTLETLRRAANAVGRTLRRRNESRGGLPSLDELQRE